MATYYKPQSPIQSGEDFIYPITTADQIMKSDKSRRLEQAGLIVADNSTSLGGIAAKDYALKTDTAPNSNKLGGKTLAEIMLTLYPVGAVYISVNSTSPASLFGGKWAQIKGRFLIGTEKPENNDDGTSPGNYNYAAGSKGGEATHKLSINEIPSHAGHLYGNAGGVNGKGDAKGAWLYEININSSLTTSYGWNYKNNEYYPVNRSLGGNAAHNNMPPYLAVYMWKRVS